MTLNCFTNGFTTIHSKLDAAHKIATTLAHKDFPHQPVLVKAQYKKEMVLLIQQSKRD